MYKPVRSSCKSKLTETELKDTNYGLNLGSGYDDTAAYNNTLTPITYDPPRGADYDEWFRLSDYHLYDKKAISPFFVYFKTAYTEEKLTELVVNTFLCNVRDLNICAIYKYRNPTGYISQTEYLENQEIPIADLKFNASSGNVLIKDCMFALTYMNEGILYEKIADDTIGKPSYRIPLLTYEAVYDSQGRLWPKDKDGYYIFYPRIKDVSTTHYFPTGLGSPLKLKLYSHIPFTFMYAEGTTITFIDVTNGSTTLATFTPSSGASKPANIFNGVTGSAVNWGTSTSKIRLKLIIGSVRLSNSDSVDISTTINRFRLVFGQNTFTSNEISKSVTVKASSYANVPVYDISIIFEDFYTTLYGGGGSASGGRAYISAPQMFIVNASGAWLTSDPEQRLYYY